jgi:AraC family transcriptional regulator
MDVNTRPAARAPVGLRLQWLTDRPGVVELTPRPDHRLLVHAGAPVRSACPDRGSRYTRRRGDISIVPAGEASVWEDMDASAMIAVHLSPELLRIAALEMGLDPAHCGLELQHLVRDPQLTHIAWALEAARRASYPSGRLYIDSLGIALAVHLLGRYSSPHTPRRGLSSVQRRRVIEFIETHVDRDLSLARLAHVAEVSVSHFKMLFRRSTGVPPHTYVMQRRVERARDLLQRSDLPASQVALAAGFSHQSHMARCMRRYLGIRPSDIPRG